MMRVVILSARTGWHTDELTRALTARGHLAAVVPYEGLIARVVDAGPQARLVDAGLPASAKASARLAEAPGERRQQTRLTSEQISLLDADVVFARIIPGGSLEQLIYRVDALHWIENRGVRVVNSPRVIERSVDKFYTTTLLHEAGLLVPETVVCERMEEAMAAVRAMGDVVIKPIFGSLGHGMVRLSDPETALRVVRALDQIKSVFYVQRAVDHGGRDLRIFVVGGRVLAAIERRAPKGEWRTNVAIGGSATAVDVSPEIERTAIAAAAAVGADYAGVDLLPARDGAMYVLEVNGIPGWQGLQQATGVDVAASIVEHVERCVRPRTSSERPEEPLPA
jgi:RimK family alpha-L-glutamate ligase